MALFRQAIQFLIQKNRQLMHLKLEVLAVMPQWRLGKLKEVVHSRQTLACAVSVANVATLWVLLYWQWQQTVGLKCEVANSNFRSTIF